MLDLDNNYYAIQFHDTEVAVHVLKAGPWRILGRYLHVQSWNPIFNFATNKINSMVVWVRLLGLPLHLYNRKVLRVLGSILGKVISIDFDTDMCTRGKYVQLVVELNLNKPIVTSFQTKKVDRIVVYEKHIFDLFSL